MNYFNTSMMMLDKIWGLDPTAIKLTLEGIKEGSQLVNDRLRNKAQEI
jgi:hypothetical protein